MPADVLQRPVRVTLVLFPVHRKALWNLRACAGMASASRVVRSLIRQVTPRTVEAMQQTFASDAEPRGSLGRFTRPSLLLDAADAMELDRLAEAAKAPSRSAVARFLILHAGRTQRAGEVVA